MSSEESSRNKETESDAKLTSKKVSLKVSLLPVLFLIGLLIINVLLFKDDATYGPNQLALLLSGMFAMAIGAFHLRVPYKDMEERIVFSVSLATQACLILLVVGALIGVWILAGIVPTMIYYGLKIIDPAWFLPVACISCAFISLGTGSSWSTSGTVGIALIGIGQAMGLNLGMVAGAIISGAYFGDKMSPLSDTTNLAPAMAGTDLFTHIRHMLYTSGPAILIAITGFFFLSLSQGSNAVNQENIAKILEVITQNFSIGWHLFLVPAFVLFLVSRKVPAFPALVLGTLMGAFFALFFQSAIIDRLASKVSSPGFWSEFERLGADGWSLAEAKALLLHFLYPYQEICRVAFNGFTIESGNELIDKLFNRGGMSGMLNTVWLILMAMVFGGCMEATGMLQKIAQSVLSLVQGTGSLIGSVVGTCLVMNMTASDQYLAIVVPGRMFKKAFDDYGLHPKNLSRALEDSGTVTSVLVPWNSGGAYHAGILGVSTLNYAPYCFFNILSPVISVFLGSMGWTIEKIREEALQGQQA